jgi:hypothetical protein
MYWQYLTPLDDLVSQLIHGAGLKNGHVRGGRAGISVGHVCGRQGCSGSTTMRRYVVFHNSAPDSRPAPGTLCLLFGPSYLESQLFMQLLTEPYSVRMFSVTGFLYRLQNGKKLAKALTLMRSSSSRTDLIGPLLSGLTDQQRRARFSYDQGVPAGGRRGGRGDGMFKMSQHACEVRMQEKVRSMECIQARCRV